jgi:hypothetical protein
MQDVFLIYPVRNNAPLGFESQRLEFLTGFTSNGSLRRIATPERFVTPRLSLAHIPYIKTSLFLKKWYALSKIDSAAKPHLTGFIKKTLIESY